MKWFKENWLVLLIIVIVLIIAFFVGRSIIKQFNEYKGEIKAKDKLIEQMMIEYQALEDNAVQAKKTAKFHKSAVSLYQDSLQDSRIKYINQKKRHAKQVADLTRIPTDNLYIDYIQWIDSISFE